MKKYAKENYLLKKLQRMLISSFHLLLTLYSNFDFHLELQCTKIYQIVQYKLRGGNYLTVSFRLLLMSGQLVIHFSKFSSIQPSSICCKDQIKNVFPQNCLQSLWQLNWKQNLFKSVAVFDCGSLLVPSKEVKLTKTKNKIGTHEPISVSISSNLNVKQYFCVAKMHNT